MDFNIIDKSMEAAGFSSAWVQCNHVIFCRASATMFCLLPSRFLLAAMHPCTGVIPLTMTVMNSNRGGAMNDESNGKLKARAAAHYFDKVFGPDSPEFLPWLANSV